MKIENGFVVDTMTNHSNTNAPLPYASRAKIIRQSDREIVATYEGSGVPSTIRRLK
jgi:hypothetical protein